MAYNPKSLENLKKGNRFRSEDGSAAEAGRRSIETRRAQAAATRELNKMVQLMMKKSSLKEFQAEITNDHTSQAMRTFALNAANPATSMTAMNWLFNRLLGKPKQVTEASIDASLGLKKPTIVFKDIENGEE